MVWVLTKVKPLQSSSSFQVFFYRKQGLHLSLVSFKVSQSQQSIYKMSEEMKEWAHMWGAKVQYISRLVI